MTRSKVRISTAKKCHQTFRNGINLEQKVRGGKLVDMFSLTFSAEKSAALQAREHGWIEICV
jgi:hypothetical protein